MKVAVFGANGRTGREVVGKAIDSGMDVVAFSRGFDGFPYENVEKVEGDAMELDDVRKAVKGVDACISTLGVTKNSPSNVVSQGVRNIREAMREEEVDRLVVLTGAGAKQPSERLTLTDRLVNFTVSLAMPGAVEDGRKMVREIQESKLKWTVVRAPKLTQRPGTGEYTVSDEGMRIFDSIPREDVADYMVEAVKRDLEIGEMPFIRA